jgi:hypothetical protein
MNGGSVYVVPCSVRLTSTWLHIRIKFNEEHNNRKNKIEDRLLFSTEHSTVRNFSRTSCTFVGRYRIRFQKFQQI